MKIFLKNFLAKNKKIKFLFEVFLLLKNSYIFPETGRRKKYPKVIQLPITYLCNAKCVMCNIPNMDANNEITPEELGKILMDPIFKKVESVGINGGEPFIKSNIEKYVEKILNLPNLKSLNIITNGFLTNIILSKSKIIYEMCKKRGINFHLSISLDGIGEIHNLIRGVPGVFDKVINTINEINKNRHFYCDSFDIGCTISKQNVEYLTQLETYANMKDYNIKYRLAIPNKRIDSISKLKNFSVFENFRDKQAAKEFFYKQFFKSKRLIDKYKYWSIYMFLSEKNPKRYLGCAWKENGITLDSKGNIYYCAVESKSLGNIRKNQNGKELFFSKSNLEYRNYIIRNKCSSCIHDYSGKIELKNIFKFLLFLIKEKFWTIKYKGVW